MAREIEIADDLRAQQAVQIRGGRNAEPGPQLLSDARAAYQLAPLEHQHPQSGAREVGGRDEAVMPSADYDKVELVCYRRPSSSKAASSGGRSGPNTSCAGT